VDCKPDIKPGWWIVTMRLIPGEQEICWILDNDQIRQKEFTMNGDYRRLMLISRVGTSAICDEKIDTEDQCSVTEEDYLF
jgi:hypothetical protein